MGNRLTKDDSVEGLTTYTYDQNDRLLTETTAGITTTYSYDDNGNLLSEISSEQQTTYTWNSENRLIGAEITTAEGTQQIEYTYDADGIRVAKTVDGDETRYLIDANRQYAQVLEEYDATTGTEVSYVYGGNELISRSREGDSRFYLYDSHSGTRQLTDEAGAVTDSYLYDAYGNVLKQIGDTENSYLYRGEQTDSETGLQYLRARYNDPSTGRLISTDPFGGGVSTPMSQHRYLYAYNNPLFYVDPSGEVTIAATLAGQSRNILSKIWGTLSSQAFQRGIGLIAGATALANQYRNGVHWLGVLPWKDRFSIPGFVTRPFIGVPLGFFGGGGRVTMTTVSPVSLVGNGLGNKEGIGTVSATYMVLAPGVRAQEGFNVPRTDAPVQDLELSVRTTAPNPRLLTPSFMAGDSALQFPYPFPDNFGRGGLGLLAMGAGLGGYGLAQQRSGTTVPAGISLRFQGIVGLSILQDVEVVPSNPLPPS